MVKGSSGCIDALQHQRIPFIGGCPLNSSDQLGHIAEMHTRYVPPGKIRVPQRVFTTIHKN